MRPLPAGTAIVALLRLVALPNSLPPALIRTQQFVVFWCASFANSPKVESAGEKRLFSRSVFGATPATGARSGLSQSAGSGPARLTRLSRTSHDFVKYTFGRSGIAMSDG